MMKRVLLIVALGVSFVAPAAFADDLPYAGFGTFTPVTGVMSGPQLDAGMANGLSDCSRQQKLDAMEADNVAHGYNRDGSGGRALAP